MLSIKEIDKKFVISIYFPLKLNSASRKKSGYYGEFEFTTRFFWLKKPMVLSEKLTKGKEDRSQQTQNQVAEPELSSEDRLQVR